MSDGESIGDQFGYDSDNKSGPRDEIDDSGGESESEQQIVTRKNGEMSLREVFSAVASSGFSRTENQEDKVRKLLGNNSSSTTDKIGECPAPLELLYDEDYSPERDFMMKYEKAKEYKKYYKASSKAVMDEVVSNWNFDKDVTSVFLRSVFGVKTLPLNLSKDQITSLIIQLTKCNIEIPPWSLTQEEYDWISTWKRESSLGGRGVLVDKKNKLFTGYSELETYRKLISDSINSNRTSSIYKTQIADITPNEVLPPSRLSITYLVKSQQELKFEEDYVRRIGQVVVRPSAATKEDYRRLVDSVRNNPYDTNKLLNDMSKILKKNLTANDKAKITQNINKNTDKGIVYLSELFSQVNLQKDEDKEDKDIRSLSLLMSQAEISKRPQLLGIEDPLQVGVTKTNRIIHTDYKDVEFIQPYRDPHFTFIGGVAETWVPVVHFVTGLPVFTKKEELLRYTRLGNIVYIKLQETSVRVDDKTLQIMYFRKFLDFNDYLKSWQETYVRKLVELDVEIEDKTIPTPVTKSFILELSKNISYRDRYIKRIRDIRNYFLNQLAGNRGDSKLEIYVADEVVEEVLKKNNDRLLKVVWDIQEILKGSLEGLYGGGYSNDTFLEIVTLKNIMKYFLRFFPSELFKHYSRISEKDKEYFRNLNRYFNGLLRDLTQFDQNCNTNGVDEVFIENMNRYEKCYSQFQEDISKYTPIYSFMKNFLPTFKRTCTRDIMEGRMIEQIGGNRQSIKTAIENGFYRVAFECIKNHQGSLNSDFITESLQKILDNTAEFVEIKNIKNEEDMLTVLKARCEIRDFAINRGTTLPCSPEEIQMKTFVVQEQRKLKGKKRNDYLDTLFGYLKECVTTNKK